MRVTGLRKICCTMPRRAGWICRRRAKRVGPNGIAIFVGENRWHGGRSNYFDDILDAELRRVAHQAKLGVLLSRWRSGGERALKR